QERVVSSEIGTALVDLLAVLADQLAFAPLETRRSAVVARRGGRCVVGLLIAVGRCRRACGGRVGDWAHASHSVLRRWVHKGFLRRLTPPGTPRHISAVPQPAIS